jgi:hypothetical protein
MGYTPGRPPSRPLIKRISGHNKRHGGHGIHLEGLKDQNHQVLTHFRACHFSTFAVVVEPSNIHRKVLTHDACRVEAAPKSQTD